MLCKICEHFHVQHLNKGEFLLHRFLMPIFHLVLTKQNQYPFVYNRCQLPDQDNFYKYLHKLHHNLSDECNQQLYRQYLQQKLLVFYHLKLLQDYFSVYLNRNHIQDLFYLYNICPLHQKLQLV